MKALLIAFVLSASVMAAQTAPEAPAPVEPERWFNIVREDGKILAAVNTKSKKVEWYGGKEESVVALFEAFRQLQSNAVAAVQEAGKACEKGKKK